MRRAARLTGMNPTDKDLDDWWAEADTNGNKYLQTFSTNKTLEIISLSEFNITEVIMNDIFNEIFLQYLK